MCVIEDVCNSKLVYIKTMKEIPSNIRYGHGLAMRLKWISASALPCLLLVFEIG